MYASSTARKKRKLHVQFPVCNLLFNSNPEPASDACVDDPMEPFPAQPLPPVEPVDQYLSPLPAVTKSLPIIRPSNRPRPMATKNSNHPVSISSPILEDWLDGVAFIAAAGET